MAGQYESLFYLGGLFGLGATLIVVPVAARIRTSRDGIIGLLGAVTLLLMIWVLYQSRDIIKSGLVLGGYLLVIYVFFVFVPGGVRLMFASPLTRHDADTPRYPTETDKV